MDLPWFAAFVWDKVNFLQSGKYEALLWIYAGKCVNKQEGFRYAEYRGLFCLLPHPATRVLRVREVLGRSRARTADSNSSQGYSITRGIVPYV